VHIYRLRKMLGSYSTQYIESIFGTGYRFQPITQERLYRSGIQLSAFPGRANLFEVSNRLASYAGDSARVRTTRLEFVEEIARYRLS
jgi:hypothetical protein